MASLQYGAGSVIYTEDTASSCTSSSASASAFGLGKNRIPPACAQDTALSDGRVFGAPSTAADTEAGLNVDTALTCTSNSASAPRVELEKKTISPVCPRDTALSDVWVLGAPNSAAHKGAELEGSGDATKPKLRLESWVAFVGGNIISVTAIISVMTQLLIVCFDDNVPQPNTPPTKDTVLFTLTVGLMVDIFFAVVLPLKYRVPLDIKSVHHIPLEALSSGGEYMMVFFVAPFSWAFIYIFGGIASGLLSVYSLCEERGGSKLELYLAISGMFMTLVGLFLLGISLIGLCSWLGSPVKRTDGCCGTVSNVISKNILSTGTFVDLVWQLQGLVWSYRTGGFGLVVAVIVGMCMVLGVLLAAIGFLALEKEDIATTEMPV